MPCREWFDEQEASYRETVIPPTVKARVSVEAGVAQGWREVVGDHGLLDVRLVDSAPTWLTGGAFGIEGSILTTLAEVCLAALLGFVLRNRAPQIEPVAPAAPIFLE